MFARTAVEAGRRSVVDASSAGGPGPALLSSLRRVGVVVTDRPAVLAWSVAVGTPCVGVLDLGAAPIFHRPAWGPATLVAAMDGDGAGVSHREVAAAVDDLTVQLHHPSSRLVLITESPAEGS